MKRISVLLLVLVITHLPISCTEDDCGPFPAMDVKITELSSSVGTFNSSGFSNSTFNNFKVAAILITIENMSYTEIAKMPAAKFSIMNTSFACSPVEPKPTHTIESISITSDNSVSFNGIEYAVGENITNLFKISRYSNFNVEITIEEFIDYHCKDPRIFGLIGDNIVFQLKEKPDQELNQVFNFQFNFSDTKIISLKSSNFEVSN